MATILCIETTTEVCSAALVKNGTVADFREDLSGLNHSRLLTVFIDKLLKSNNLKASTLDAVAVSKGPGSYTGLRIGVSVAKGICYGAALPLITVCPLEAMANYVVQQQIDPKSLSGENFFIPMIDARRMEVYTAVFNQSMEKLQDVSATVIDENSFSEFTEKGTLWLFGNGSAKCREALKNGNIRFIDGIYASAKHMAPLANTAFLKKQFADLAYFEPFYLKDFIATAPKNSVLGKK
jgi:tRNA threonylcarbamoyladenosine biosynthesis protein TsaB